MPSEESQREVGDSDAARQRRVNDVGDKPLPRHLSPPFIPRKPLGLIPWAAARESAGSPP